MQKKNGRFIHLFKFQFIADLVAPLRNCGLLNSVLHFLVTFIVVFLAWLITTKILELEMMFESKFK